MRTLEDLDLGQLELVTGGVNRPGPRLDDVRAPVVGADVGALQRPGMSLAGFQVGVGEAYRPGFLAGAGALADGPVAANEAPAAESADFGELGAVPELDFGAALPDFATGVPELDAVIDGLAQGDFGAALDAARSAALGGLGALGGLAMSDPGATTEGSQQVGVMVCGNADPLDGSTNEVEVVQLGRNYR
jgi:hypothetical protein